MNICRESGIVVGVLEDAGESNVVGVGSEADVVDGVGEFYCVPKFFGEEVELDGEGQHYKIKHEASDGVLFEVDGDESESWVRGGVPTRRSMQRKTAAMRPLKSE